MDAVSTSASPGAPQRFADRAAAAPCSAAQNCTRPVTSYCVWRDMPDGDLIIEPVCAVHGANIRQLIRASGGRWVSDIEGPRLTAAVADLAATGERLVLPPPHGRHTAELRLGPDRDAAGSSPSAKDGRAQLLRRTVLLAFVAVNVEVAIVARLSGSRLPVLLVSYAAIALLLLADRQRRATRRSVTWSVALGSLVTLAFLIAVVASHS